MQEVAARAGVGLVLSSHERYDDRNRQLDAMRAEPAGPNPFIVGQGVDDDGRASGPRDRQDAIRERAGPRSIDGVAREA